MRMPERKHLRRLDVLTEASRTPLFLVTCCVARRAPLLAREDAAAILREAWRDAASVHGWLVGRYVVMPDHVHFFATPGGEQAKNVSGFVGGWKQWTARRIREQGLPRFRWQMEFFDHLVRSDQSYAQKWEYVCANPVRAGLVDGPREWPFQGEVSVLHW